MFKKTTFIFTTLLAIAGFLLSYSTILAAPDYAQIRDEGFAARYVSQSLSDPVQIQAGDTQTVVFTFKNVGTKNWDSSSANFISAYTMNPRYRASDFQAQNWLEYRQSAKIAGVVRPGETGELALQLKAPSTPGHYKEEFWLAADGWSWVKGGYFYIEIDVVDNVEVVEDITQPEEVTEEIGNTDSPYKGNKFMQSKKEISAAGGERIKLIVGYQNVGETAWDGYAFVTGDATLSSEGSVSFVDDTWKDSTTIVQKSEQVPQWEAAKEKFYIKMPSKKGEYTLTLKLQVGEDDVSDTVLYIPVTVTENSPYHVDSSNDTVTTPTQSDLEQPRLEEEPRIRVGIWRDPEEGVEFISNDDDYIIYAGETRRGVLKKGQFAYMFFAGGTYQYQSDSFSFMTTNYIRLVPENNIHAVYTLSNYDREVSWKGPVNFNKYRGVLEYRQTEDGVLYAINELLFEDYIAGIAETSNVSPIEYIKALLTAARTYAYYVQQYSGKHDSRHFDVVAHTGDQLYLGYESEKLMSRVKEAQEATRGYMVTYDSDNNSDTQSDVVITPYFGNSDGRTRSWTDVWGGSAKPWLVPVTAKYDRRDGKSMYGHGVGMSARDAAYMAEEEKVDFQTILKYYYTGVNVEKIYK